MGRMVLTVLGMVAEMELGFIRDRQRAGIDAAKAKGVYKGRPATFDLPRNRGPAQGRDRIRFDHKTRIYHHSQFPYLST